MAVPAAAGDMDNYSVSLSAGPSMQVLTTAPRSVSLSAGPGRLFYHGVPCLSNRKKHMCTLRT